MDYDQMAIDLHAKHRGKIAVQSKVPLETMDDLSTAYTPGVAAVCMEIARDRSKAYKFTNKGNMVAVVSDGSAVLGLGNIGPEGSMPVMEGKALLFKELAGIDAWPICISAHEPEEIVMIVRSLAPTFGAVNLEDIAAPKCFIIEESLQDLGIPVFHDDQHGTAVVVLAAMINAVKVVNKEFHNIKVVFSGAGAGGIACAKILQVMGVENIILVDTRGAIYKGRGDLTHVKEEIAMTTNPDQIQGDVHVAIQGADVFIGLSAANLLTAEDIRSMSKDAIVLAMANPMPEISPEEAKKGGATIFGTGRSDLPNQINNVLAFPGILRGALDVRADRITMRMKVAAGHAIAALVDEPTPEEIIPYPLNPAVVPAVSKAVADAWNSETR
ncbi:MAG: NADP-dependent malic enzyme [Chloroflexi bacterium]|nr:NADP-dependent malic enzyme [Chloroflexota bacterium]MCI0771028.1 NADP-dependent malic enzyme [Chloroflexota bacterium]MCI0796429.1 NADP-dependent malic enzyme [Chloroflexota bacterium]MCI0812955.1 NADP-dependent malic enzyme [Chloroflexota bacterium]